MTIPWEPAQALYLHIPFCVRRCAYCDFATEATPREDPRIDEAIEALALTVRHAAATGDLNAVRTLYIGGGTPTHVGARRLSFLLSMIGVSLALTPDMEVTIEANPESLTRPLVRDLYALGVNRISIGVQSFDNAVLRRLGRAHDGCRARQAIEDARDRFDNVSIDLMAAIPGQSAESLLASIETALALEIPHISLYPLMIEPATPLAALVAAGTLSELDEDAQAAELEAASSRLRDAGYRHYEVASFARPGYACRHNQAYWRGIPYEGFGPSAVSMRQTRDRRERLRDGVIVETLDRPQMIAEDLMLAMRMDFGIGPELAARARAELTDFDAVVDEIIGFGLARWDGSRLVPTERGFLLGNETFGRLLALAP